MFIQLFSRYLAENDIITAQQRKDLLAKQFTTRPKLGTIAVAEKLLTKEQAEELNHLQMLMDKRFGDLAVEKGYLTEADINKLLEKQGNPYLLFVQLMEDELGISNEVVEKYLKEYQTSHGFTDHEIETLKIDDIDSLLTIIAPASNSYVTDIVGLILRNITRFVTGDFYVGKIHRVAEHSYQRLIGQKVLGDHSVLVAFMEQASMNGLTNLAKGFAKEDLEAEVDLLDAVGEFTNCINGLYATLLGTQGEDIDMLPPEAHRDSMIKGVGYVLPLTIEDQDLELFIAIDSDCVLGENPISLEKALSQERMDIEEGKETVLIVDDSRMSREMLKNILKEVGYQVIGEAVDGEDGVEQYKRLKPDVVTLDVTMPKMDGIEALKQIIAFDANANVVMITAAGQQKRIIEALKIGASKFITKPFDKDDIANNM